MITSVSLTQSSPRGAICQHRRTRPLLPAPARPLLLPLTPSRPHPSTTTMPGTRSMPDSSKGGDTSKPHLPMSQGAEDTVKGDRVAEAQDTGGSSQAASTKATSGRRAGSGPGDISSQDEYPQLGGGSAKGTAPAAAGEQEGGGIGGGRSVAEVVSMQEEGGRMAKGQGGYTDETVQGGAGAGL